MTGITATSPSRPPLGGPRLPPEEEEDGHRQDLVDDSPEPPEDDERLVRLAEELELLSEVDGPKDLF